MNRVVLEAALDADPRPCFVIDLDEVVDTGVQLKIKHFNRSARSHKAFLELVSGPGNQGAGLRRWANTADLSTSSDHPEHNYKDPYGFLWFAYDIDNRWRVVQRTSTSTSAILFDVVTPPADATSTRDNLLTLPDHELFMDFRVWTDTPCPREIFGLSFDALEKVEGLRSQLDTIAAFDWSLTSLGNIRSWTTDLLQSVHLLLLNPSPQCLILGNDRVLLYNAAYGRFAGARHPSILGQSIHDAWEEMAEVNISALASIDSTGCPFVMDDYNISLDRSNDGASEDLHLKWTIIPLEGFMQGYLCTISDETAQKVKERRMSFLHQISEACWEAQDLIHFWSAVSNTMAAHDKDFPFAILYSKKTSDDCSFELQSVLGDKNISNLPANIDLKNCQECFAPAMMAAVTTGKPVVISQADITLPEHIISLSATRGYEDQCLYGTVCPIASANDQEILGVLILGRNNRKPVTLSDEAFVDRIRQILGQLAARTLEIQSTNTQLTTITTEAEDVSARLKRLVKLVEMVDVGLFEFQADGTLSQANEAYYTLTSYPRKDAPPHAWRDNIHDDDLTHVESNWFRAGMGEQVEFEMRYKVSKVVRGDNDDSLWAKVFAVPVMDESGAIVCISGCATDITAQKRRQLYAIKRAEALEQLRASEKRFYQFTEQALCPIFMYSADMKLQFCNDAYCELIGGEAGKDVAMLDGMDLIHEDDLEEFHQKWDEANREVRSMQHTFRLKRQWKGPDNQVGNMWVVASTYPETDNEGNISGWMGVLFDVSQIKWAERVQELRMQEAVEAKRQQENFIDMTSHEIRNPLGAVVHCADSILASMVDLELLTKEVCGSLSPRKMKQLLEIYESSFDAVNTIISCSTHQRRIVDDVLTWSKLNSNLLKIMPSRVRPRAILQDISNMFELDAEKVGVSLIVNEADDVDNVDAEWVMLDPGRLMQVLINLVANAIKFTREESSRRVTVTMGATSTKPDLPLDFVASTTMTPEMDSTEWGTGECVFLYFMVEDTGCGLSSEEKSRIFSRFSQGSPRTHTKYGGSGLGLFISRELVELQRGEIGFASNAGVGSNFGFYIKVCKAQAQRGPETPTLRSGRLNSSATSTGQRYSILVVEDNLVNQAVLSKQLRKLGHEVHVANDGNEALDFIQTTKAWRPAADTPMKTTFAAKHGSGNYNAELNVILMDVEMPVMDGLTCAAEIRRLQRDGFIDGHLPIIAVSANARVEQIDLAIDCGMDDAISKPFRIADLMPKIERLVG